ncbi:unnamed protein product [Merluccius merluccius]
MTTAVSVTVSADRDNVHSLAVSVLRARQAEFLTHITTAPPQPPHQITALLPPVMLANKGLKAHSQCVSLSLHCQGPRPQRSLGLSSRSRPENGAVGGGAGVELCTLEVRGSGWDKVSAVGPCCSLDPGLMFQEPR